MRRPEAPGQAQERGRGVTTDAEAIRPPLLPPDPPPPPLPSESSTPVLKSQNKTSLLSSTFVCETRVCQHDHHILEPGFCSLHSTGKFLGMTKSQDPAQSFPLCSAGDSPPPSRGPSPRLRHVPEGAFPASDCKCCSRLFSSFTLGSYDHSGRPRCLCPAGFFLEPPSLITSGAAPLPCSQTGCSSAALPPNTCPSQTHPLTQGWGPCGLLLQLQGWNPGISRVACALSPP